MSLAANAGSEIPPPCPFGPLRKPPVTPMNLGVPSNESYCTRSPGSLERSRSAAAVFSAPPGARAGGSAREDFPRLSRSGSGERDGFWKASRETANPIATPIHSPAAAHRCRALAVTARTVPERMLRSRGARGRPPGRRLESDTDQGRATCSFRGQAALAVSRDPAATYLARCKPFVG